MPTTEQLALYLNRIAEDRVQTLAAEVERLEKVRAHRTMTPDAEVLWIGETLDEAIGQRLLRLDSFERLRGLLAPRNLLPAGTV